MKRRLSRNQINKRRYKILSSSPEEGELKEEVPEAFRRRQNSIREAEV